QAKIPTRMLNFLRKQISDQNPLRLLYHKLIAVVAAFYYRFPSNRLKVIAVTGTNGKTTTCSLIAQLLQYAGHKVGLMSTVYFQIGDKKFTNLTKQTTQGRFFLQKMLRQMVDAGCEYAVVESSSHAMVQSRLWGVNVDTAVFTNLTHDHIDYHGSFTAYKEAKGELFNKLNRSSRKAGVPKLTIVNQDDPESEYFLSFPADQKYTFGLQGGIYRASHVRALPGMTRFDYSIPNGQAEISMPLPGVVNVYNAAAAATVAVSEKISIDTIKAAFERIQAVPGRMEMIDCGQLYNVVVDYAHAPDALESLIKMFRPLTEGKLWLVFGATGGGRDTTKRPIMGRIADKGVDNIILTDDDPYQEDNIAIIEQVAKGIDRGEGDRFWKVPSRREAIRLALSGAREGDTVLLAGKGAEEFQVTKDGRVPHDDRQVAREILSREIDVEIGA
ncbi:MAG: UDP-N-acetylmuramoyl-L-alanyl-D-glutamate--2,6-diaminopimelate ligase, partial [Patescibacteria group bacterium]